MIVFKYFCLVFWYIYLLYTFNHRMALLCFYRQYMYHGPKINKIVKCRSKYINHIKRLEVTTRYSCTWHNAADYITQQSVDKGVNEQHVTRPGKGEVTVGRYLINICKAIIWKWNNSICIYVVLYPHMNEGNLINIK